MTADDGGLACPSWCVVDDQHDHHCAETIAVHLSDGNHRHGDMIELVVERLDTDDLVGAVEVAFWLATSGRQRELFTAISPVSARRLSAALVAAADVADGVQ
jgi:hypothetical protein